MQIRRTAFLAVLAGILCTSLWADDDQQAQGQFSVPITVTANNTAFPGTFVIKKFAVINNQLNAVGTLTTALLTKSGMTTAVTSIAVPVTTTGSSTAASTPDATLPSAAESSITPAAAAASCPILHLVLGPLDLNLLGLTVHLNQVVLDINAIPGPGNLLGNLLCDIANLLNPGGALQNLVNALNQLLRAL